VVSEAMTAPLLASRVEELREFFGREIPDPFYLIIHQDTANELRAILSDYSSLRAENERLKDEHDKRRVEYMGAIATMRTAKLKAEAELEVAEGTIEEITKAWCLDAAQLAKQAPLIQASRAVLADHDERMVLYPSMEGRENRLKTMSELRAALKLREGEGK